MCENKWFLMHFSHVFQSRRHQNLEQANSLSRLDPRRQTISGTNDLRRQCSCQEDVGISTEKLLEDDHVKCESAKRKNPDLYIEDTAALFSGDR